jgi:tetratricopeptide (TPR) repeat protein
MRYIRSLTVCYFLLFGSCCVQSQPSLNPFDRWHFKRAKKAYAIQKYSKAENLLLPLTVKYSSHQAIWNLLSQVELLIYYERKSSDLEYQVTRTGNPADTSESQLQKNDSLTRILLKLMNSNPASVPFLRKAEDLWRLATLRCERASTASVILRTFFIDPPDLYQQLPPKALAEFNLAENDHVKQNHTQAIQHYQQALAIDSSFYEAQVGLGSVLFESGAYVTACSRFREAIRLQPNLQEPRKCLVNTLLNMGAWAEAQQEAMDALILYPDAGLFVKLEEAAKAQNKQFNRHWLERQVLPNTMGDQPLNEKGDRDWMEYINGFSLIEKHCNKEGIVVQKNQYTQTHYAEVFSWEYMLSKTALDKFEFARKMQQAGYLDCYVLF